MAVTAPDLVTSLLGDRPLAFAPMRVLLVEDEPRLRQVVAAGLRRRGIAVDEAANGRTALQKAALHAYEVVVLDRGLPDVPGDEVCSQLREREPAPLVLMLTALASPRERVAGFAAGADDYLPKPFVFEELVARLCALGRRSASVRPAVLQRSGIRLDPARRTVARDGRRVELTVKEFAVLEALPRADGAIVSAEELLETVWDELVDPFTNTVRVTIMRLRRKLGEPSPIVTHPAVGYSVP